MVEAEIEDYSKFALNLNLLSQGESGDRQFVLDYAKNDHEINFSETLTKFCLVNWTDSEIEPNMFYGYRNNTWSIYDSFFALINTNVKLFKCWFQQFREKTHQLHPFFEGISLDILIYLRAEEPRLIKDEYIFRYAIEHGNTDIYDYLKDKIDCNKFNWPLTIGSIDILERMYNDCLNIYIHINGSLYKMNYDARAYMIFYAAGLFHKETTEGLIYALAKCKDDKVIHLLEQILEPHLLPENPTSYTDKSSDDEHGNTGRKKF